MNNSLPPSDEALDALFAQARAHRPDTGHAEYGFETRLMQRILKTPEESSIWSTVSWRMASILAVAVLALAYWGKQADAAAQNSEQVAYVENPEAVDLVSTF